MTLQDSQNSADIDVDKLMDEINAPTPERPMSGGETETPAPAAAAPQAEEKQTPQEYEYEWSGKKIKEPLDMILKRAGMGYDYAQKMEALKRDQSQYKTQLQKELEEKYKPYKRYDEINEYVQKDPQWWKHVEESWNQRLASEDPNVKRLQSVLDERLKPVEQLLAQKDQEAVQAKITQEDQELTQSIKSIREKYSDLDWDTPDAEGKSLEYKVLKHGAENGFKSFTAAFRDFYHDQLEARAEARGREAIGKEAQKRQKLGLSGTPPTPRQKPSDAYDTKGKTMDQIFQEVLQRENISF